MSRVTNISLSEHIMRLRVTAAALYDTGVNEGMPPEEIHKDILPVTKALHELIVKAANEDIAGIAIAVKRLENQAKCHSKDAAYLQQKASEDMYYADLLKKAVAARMKIENIDHLQAAGFMATKDPKSDQVTFR